MVIAGLGIGLLPGVAPDVPRVELEPDTVLLLFLPPILFSAAYFLSPRELWRNIRPITLLAVGLVIMTTLAVAVVAMLLAPQMGWPVAIALGAIVSPPDAIAATSIARRLNLPRRLVIIFEGESLVNDATALTIYRLAVTAAVDRREPEPGHGRDELRRRRRRGDAHRPRGRLDHDLDGGAAPAAAADRGARRRSSRRSRPTSRPRPSASQAWSRPSPPACYLGWRAPRILRSDTRLLATGTWQMVIFVVNGLAFLLVGLQLPVVHRGASRAMSPASCSAWRRRCPPTVIARPPGVGLPGDLPAALARSRPWPAGIRHRRRGVVLILGWGGMRGAVSLAAALALPHVTATVSSHSRGAAS